MVRFGWPVKTAKHSAPSSERDTYSSSPYQEDHGSPAALPSTTSSAVPTPHTTTNATPTAHFLSLPMWRRRRDQQVNPPQRRSMFDLRTYETDLDHHREQRTSSPREKSLPPTPTSSNEDASDAHMRRPHSPIESQSWSSGQARHSTAAPPPVRSSPSNAKIALVQAALAIGLPHGMPQVSASSSRSDVDSMGFVTIPQPPRYPHPSPSVRRAKSFQQLSRKFGRERDDDPPSVTRRPTIPRGIPLGAVNAFESDGKGKDKALDDIPSHVTPPRKSLVRRASFWSRKRHDSSKPAAAPLPSEHRNSLGHLSHVLPSLPPMSPFNFDANVSRSSRSSQTEEQLPPSPPGLNPRSDSRNRSLPPSLAVSSTPDLSVQTVKAPPHRRPRRPSTADPTTDRSRTLPNNAHSPNHTTQPTSSPSPQHPDVSTLRRTARPRSQTNPPLFHRLSANLFSFGSSSSSLFPPTSGANGVHITNSPGASPGASPRASTSKLSPPKPRPREESPTSYVDRLLDAISKADVASALASRYDPVACQFEFRS
jgi:hypothetical protein